MPNPLWILRAFLARLKRRYISLWHIIHARTARPQKIPVEFAHHVEPRSIGSYEIGEELKQGQFFFAGKQVDVPEGAIWKIASPSPDFTADMHGFNWLDDLAAVGDSHARILAQTWVLEWIERYSGGKGPGWTPALSGRRILRICAHGEFLFNRLEAHRAGLIFHSLARQVNFLEKSWRHEAGSWPRLEALTGLIFAGVCFDGRARSLHKANKAIGAEAAHEISADGAISTRNPEELMELFTLYTWVMRTLEDAGETPDPRLITALENIGPTLRSLRLGDGSLARFHGGGRGREGRLDQVLSDSRIRGNRTGDLAMGFERLTSGRITVLVDCASPPPFAFSQHAHASTLAFEMSSGRFPMVVNCGAGQKFGPEWEHVCRETGAHNTIVLDGISSAKMAPEGYVSQTFGQRLLRMPGNVTRKRAADHLGVALRASHDGYKAIHHRHLHLSPDGQEFTGQDSFSAPKDAPALQSPTFEAHFHLHPNVRAKISDDKQTIALQLPNKEVWTFRQTGGEMTLEDSVYLDQWRLKPHATKQIVVSGTIVEYAGQIHWFFKRVKDGACTSPIDRNSATS